MSGGSGASPPEPGAALEAARASQLIRSGEPLLVLLSGGADSVCLLDCALALGAEVSALHVNHGLRPSADSDEELCRELCARLEVPLTVQRVSLHDDSPGNLQAEAREARYALAEGHAAGDYAAGHTASDQAETVLYRLATSPGRRALLGMAPRRGRLVRPLLEASRAETHAHCDARSLPYADDPTNADLRYARARVRHEVMPSLRSLNSAAERTIVETAAMLREEEEVLERAVEQALDQVGRGPTSLVALKAQPPGVARLVLRRLAEEAAGRPFALGRDRAESVLLLAERGGSHSLDLGGGVRAVVEYGTVRFAAEPDAALPEPVRLRVPGSARFGRWEVTAAEGSSGEAIVLAEALGPVATVRSWRAGDRMRPAGLGGTKSLQDLFTDRKVPRSLRRSLPVVEAGGAIAWVAGVAVDERFAASGAEGERPTVALAARQTGSSSRRGPDADDLS
jgi:tRNA(Ile)-lysidine synthase